jgi:outer membrane protein assembly factor BamE (lipoprotein component of BamABCDE complex)
LVFLLKGRNVPISITSYPSSAKLYIDESYIGDTPINSYKLSIGSHTIKILKDGYKEYNTSVNINSETNPEMKFTLAALTGTISVSSNPSSAEVYINNDNKGVTPLTVILIPGNYTVNITKDGYDDYTTTSTVKPDLTSTVSAILKTNTGKLSVSSSPTGAQIYLNGSYKGVTPLTLTLSPGSYAVKITKDGYNDYTTTSTVKLYSTSTVSATIKRNTGTLSVSSSPTGAKIYLNGSYKGVTPLTLTLSPGSYAVKITKDGYNDYTTTSTVSLVSTSTVNPTLNKKSITYFKLGSSTTEVKSIMGTPSEIDDYTVIVYWHYGSSSVTFEDGAVTGWRQGSITLKVNIGNAKSDASPFKLGSTYADVINAMGTPSEIDDYTVIVYWHYGSSSVTFENGAVTGWRQGNVKLKVK